MDMSDCQKELKAAGKSYPRTCPKCGLGPCVNGHDRPVFKNADVAYGGRLNGMNEIDRMGEYIGLSIDGVGRVKFNVSQARAVAKDILDATQ